MHAMREQIADALLDSPGMRNDVSDVAVFKAQEALGAVPDARRRSGSGAGSGFFMIGVKSSERLPIESLTNQHKNLCSSAAVPSCCSR